MLQWYFILAGRVYNFVTRAARGSCEDTPSQANCDFALVINRGRGGGSYYFPYILLNEIQTMFSQLAKRSAKVLPADLCTDHAHYVKNHRSTVFRRTKNMEVEGGTVSHYYVLVIRKFIDFMSLFRHSVWFSFSDKQFPSAEPGICNT